MTRKPDAHRAEMAARAERRAQRSQRTWQEGPTPGRAKAKPTETPPEARRLLAKNKRRDDRRRLRRIRDAAATAQGRLWKPPD